MRKEIFRMERVTYREQEVVLLEDFNLNIFAGEIMGFIPINGLGMNAFLNLLGTNLPLYDGYIYYQEEKINSWHGARKGNNRITIIQNKSCLVDRMTVADNIFVLRHGFRKRVIQTSLLEKQLAPFLRDIGMNISADTDVEKLTIFERVVVELLRAVVAGHRLIVLNEVSSLLSGAELKKLYTIMKYYTGQGFSFLYISLHFEDVAQICNRIALMVDGHIEKIMQEREMDRDKFVEYTKEYDRMVRHHLAEKKDIYRKTCPIFEARNVCIGNVKKLNFRLAQGECIVIQNTNTSGFKDIMDIFMGECRLESGEMLLEGKPIELQKDRKVAVIQEIPTISMLFPEMNYMDNLCFTLDKRIHGVWSRAHIRNSIRQEYGKVLGRDIFDKPIEELDKKQKLQLVYTRILLQKPKVVFCIQPFKGADLPHRMYIWKLLEQLLEKGISVVILAVNLADTLSLADRLIQIDKNYQMKEFTPKDYEEIPITAPWQYLYKEQHD